MLLVGGRVKNRTWGRRAPKRESATSEVEESQEREGGRGLGWISHGWHAAERVRKERERLAIILARLSNKAINCRRSSRRREKGERKGGSERERCKGNIKIRSNTFTPPLQVWQVSPSPQQLELPLGNSRKWPNQTEHRKNF